MYFRCISGVYQVYFKPSLLSLLIGVGSYGRVKSFISPSSLYCAVVMRTVQGMKVQYSTRYYRAGKYTVEYCLGMYESVMY